MITTAVILAAGRGTRLGVDFRDRPKGSLVMGGATLIDRSIELLNSVGINRVVVGTGHCSEYYEELSTTNPSVQCVKNPDYATTGSMSTLLNLAGVVDSDCLLLESDLIYERFALVSLLDHPAPDVVLGSGWTQSSDEVYIETDAHGQLVNMSKDPAALRSTDAELVGITKLSLGTLGAMCEIARVRLQSDARWDYEYAVVAAAADRPIFVHRENHLAWGEIDDDNHRRRVEHDVLPMIHEHDRRTNSRQ